ncbi:MAG: DUF123 domain-containing protein [Caldithrix sp.]|nr:DUF123 domain-containing protein [Caldithrix sp.]
MKTKHQSYQLFLEVNKDLSIFIGALGFVQIPAGSYVYTGSARRNIDERIKRHLNNNKKLHWHIDYLLTNPHVHISTILKSELEECALNQQVEGIIITDRFGAGDCIKNCKSHLKKISGY